MSDEIWQMSKHLTGSLYRKNSVGFLLHSNTGLDLYRKKSSELIELFDINTVSLVLVSSCSITEAITDDSYWTSSKGRTVYRTDRKRRIEGFNCMKNTSKSSSFRPKALRRERTLILRRGGSSLEMVFIRTDRTIQYNKVSLGLN
jgi:hypothetical protein